MTTKEKWEYTQSDKKVPLEEFIKSPYLHFCCEWDGLLIEEGDPEFEACDCYAKEDRPDE